MNKDIRALRGELEITFGRPIRGRADCEQLSTEIFERTGKLISYNTVRRLFGLAGSSRTKTSISSLNILANYCGYQDYQDILKQQQPHETSLEKLYQLLIRYKLHGAIDLVEVKLLLNNHKENSHLYRFVHELVQLAYEIDDLPFITQIFQLEPLITNKHFLHLHLFFIIQSVGVRLRHLPQREEIWLHWAQIPAARSLYFEFFVDMDFLNKGHHIAIERYLEHSSTDASYCFGHLLLFFHHYSKGKRMEAEMHIQQLSDMKPLQQHPILAARLITYRWLYMDKVDENEWQWLMSAMSQFRKMPALWNKVPYFHVWLCEGLCLLGEFNKVLAIVEMVAHQFSLKDNYVNAGLTTRLQIYEYMALINKGRWDEAGALRLRIDTNLLNSYSFLYDQLFLHTAEVWLHSEDSYKETLQQKAAAIGYECLITKWLTFASQVD